MEINKEQFNTDSYFKEKNMRVFQEETLFPLPVKESVAVDRCPKCNNKLETNLKKTLKICNNKRVHAKPFLITPSGYYKMFPKKI